MTDELLKEAMRLQEIKKKKEFLEAIKEQYKDTMLPDNLDVIFLEAFEDYLDMIKKTK